ncbi:hypothetical protein [Rhizobium halophytocola]|uniref:Uncharacterized protein n=1 Tax=Rhizobium halophytocola TaxID=735519 RepID=A0ABS4DWP1_9HYPH|nr:hypothetical protein [Rhizobium halophytocola]MBP1850112.1 hypothetical protein [Rhizobium halophytocola]
MLNKVTVINLLWMMTMTAMLATSVGFYMENEDQATFYGPPISARYHSFGH